MNNNESICWYYEIADSVREQRGPGDEGSFWVLFLDHERVPGVSMVLPAAADLGEAEYGGLATVIDEVGAPAAIVVIPRAEGDPFQGDLRLWVELKARLAGAHTDLVDLVVVGDQTLWSALGVQFGEI